MTTHEEGNEPVPVYSALNNYRRLVTLAVRGIACYAIATGLFTLWGRDRRMDGPAYITLRNVADALNISPALGVGVFILLAGMLTALPHYRASQVGLWLVMAWSLMTAVSFAASVYKVPAAGVLGITCEAMVGLMALGLLAVRHADAGCHA